MIKVVLFRALRGLIFSALGTAIAHYSANPIYGPIATAIGLALDKWMREVKEK